MLSDGILLYELPSYKLESICSELKIKVNKSHRALDDSENSGMVLSFDLGVIQNYLNLMDDDLNNDDPDVINCIDLVNEENCNEYSFCEFNHSTQECELNLDNPYSPVIDKDFEGELFQFDVEINNNNIDMIDEINFYLNNIAFIYLEQDPSNDNYNIDSNVEGTENNSLWDWNDLGC